MSDVKVEIIQEGTTVSMIVNCPDKELANLTWFAFHAFSKQLGLMTQEETKKRT